MYTYCMGILYLVSTPIGNLRDITLRAKEVLASVDIIACEDTRKTGRLLERLSLSKQQFLSYYEENEAVRIPQIIQLLKTGKNVALVSNAGTPSVSDPGFKLVRECITQGIKIEPIPGPSAILTALVVSGLPTDKFLFLGFLPKKQGKRKKIFTCLPEKTTIIFFESPYRLEKTLKEIKEIFGNIKVVVCRELTKIHQEIRREPINQAIKYFKKTRVKGEITLLFNVSQV